MRPLKIFVSLLFAIALVIPYTSPNMVEGQSAQEALTTDLVAETDDLWNGLGIKGTHPDEGEEPAPGPLSQAAPDRVQVSGD